MRTIAFALAAAFAAPAPQPPPTFRSTTDLVEVDVLVHDRGGNAVADLTQADFDLREDGKAQLVQQFYLVHGAAVVNSTARSGSEASAVTRPAPSAPTQRTFIAVFDTDHLTPGGFKRVQAAASTLFGKEFQPGDIGGVVTNGSVANGRLTSNREELLAAIKAAKPSGAVRNRTADLREWPSMNEAEALMVARYGLSNDQYLEEVLHRACAEDPVACQRQSVDQIVYEKGLRITTDIRTSSEQTLHTLASLMNALASVPGRKTVTLLSEGFIAEESWPSVQAAVELAARANVRVYSLDARGLDKGRQPIGNYAPHDDTLGNLLASFDIGSDSINSLAVDTGGFAVRNTNIFDQAIAEIAAEAGTYYVLGFRAAALDGKFHKLSVTVKRPGVVVRARRGFVASPKPAVMTAAVPAQPAPIEATKPESPVVPESAATAETPASAPESTSASNAEATVTNAAPSNGLRFRPDASKHIDLLLKNEPADEAARRGWDAYQRGDVAGARASLEVAAASASAHPWVHYALGLSDYALRAFKESAAQWETVRRAEPAFEPVYFDLVDSYLQLHEQDEAVKVLRGARDRWPKDPDVYNALGVVQTSRGVVDDAVKAFQQAVTLAPQDPVGHFNLGRALEMRYNRTRRYVQQLGRWVTNERDRTDAIEHYQECIKLGGAFAESAQEGVTRLNWAPKN